MLADYRDTIYHCLKCGACKQAYEIYMPICPSGMKYGFDSHYAIGRISLARAILDEEIKLDADVMQRIYTCTNCGACDEQCHDAVGVDPLQVIQELKYEAVEKGLIPPEVRDYLKHMNVYGNPYMLPAADRGKWALNLGIEAFGNQEYLFYVGDVGSYDGLGQQIAQAVAKSLAAAGISLGIMGEKEITDGNEINLVGESGLCEYFATANIDLFKKHGVKKIITLSPHAYNIFKNNYPAWGGSFEVKHYSQVLAQAIHEKKLIPKGTPGLRVTFHDPCFLGRHNHEYDAPRQVLNAIPGVELVEMERTKNNALCCGGGGGNLFTDLLGSGPKSPGRIRVREAMDTGARIIITACPKCFIMLEDAVKAENAEDRIVVKDLAQMLL
jgi:Fe-S oxidoreductase